MPVPNGRNFSVLCDTNAILEAHRIRCWKALASAYRMETVETCVIETLTGHQNRTPEQNVDQGILTQNMKAIHPVTDRQRATLQVDYAPPELDAGERDLWAHAVGRTDTWILCSPDKASVRFARNAKLTGRLVSVEELLLHIGHRPMPKLRDNYTRKWLANEVAKHWG